MRVNSNLEKVLSKDWLYEEYVAKDKTSRQIAQELGLKSKTSILRQLRRYSIPLKTRESRIGKKINRNSYVAGKITRTFWHIITKGALTRNIEFTVTPQYLWELFIKQEGKCKLSGQELIIDFVSSKDGRRHKTASLDRIDPSKGYIPGNVQWVHKLINQIKWDLTQDEFIELCHQVSANCGRNKL